MAVRTGGHAMKRLIAVPALLVVLLASCASTRHLDTVELERSTLKIDVRGETAARVDADYHVKVDADDPLGTMISVGTSFAKATQVQQVRGRLERATEDLDLAQIVEEGLSEFFTSEFGAQMVQQATAADYLLIVEVQDYGIEAGSWSSAVEMRVEVLCKLFRTDDGRRVWRNRVSVSQEASPAFFGLSGVAGNVVSAGVLSELTEEEIARGMERLSRRIALEIAYEFEDDFYRARF